MGMQFGQSLAGPESNMWSACGMFSWDLEEPPEGWLGRRWDTGGGEREVGLFPQGCCLSFLLGG